MKYRRDIDIQYIRECFDLIPEEGVLIWKNRPVDHFESKDVHKRWNTKFAGTVAGFVSKDRRQVSINNTYYIYARVVWALHYGVDPGLNTIDHINGDPLDDRISNLRLATASQNGANKKIPSHNTSGFKNVRQHKDGKWIVVFQQHKKQYCKRGIKSLTAALQIKQKMGREIFGEYYTAG